MVPIGFTTGSLYKSSINFEDVIKLYSSLGAEAIELSFAKPIELLQYRLSKDSIKETNKFRYVSIHAPWKEIEYGSNEITERVIEKLKFLCENLPVEGIVLHPDTLKNFEILPSWMPFLLENMDKRKSFGTHPEHFEQLKKHDFKFVLDINYGYEQDSSMQLTKKLIYVMGDKLRHMHVSGNNSSELHVPVHLSHNKDSIIDILGLGIRVPKILEGILMGDVIPVIKTELDYIRRHEAD